MRGRSVRDRSLGVDYVEKSPGTILAVDVVKNGLGAGSRAEAIRDAACLLAALVKEAEEQGTLGELRKRVQHARAEFGVSWPPRKEARS